MLRTLPSSPVASVVAPASAVLSVVVASTAAVLSVVGSAVPVVAVEEDDETGTLVTNIYEPGGCWHEKPHARHRVTAIEDSTFIEVSTPHLDDVVRIQDDFGR